MPIQGRHGHSFASTRSRRPARRWRASPLDQAGFTLIELLIVVIILGVLAGLVGPRLFGRVGQSRQAAARVQIELLGAALDQFKLDVGRYPNSQEGLQALQQSPGNAPGWEGPYLKKDVPRDPWGSAYQYRSPGEHGEYDLASLGSDGAAGGEGEASDITSWGAEGKTR
jgi:general secretion pathway protein G